MLVAWALCAVGLVAAASSEGAKYDPVRDLDAYPSLRRGLLRYRQHMHGHLRARHPKMALAHHSVASVHHSHLDAELDSRLDSEEDARLESQLNSELDADVVPAADDKAAVSPLALPGRHPSVEKALDGMKEDLTVLKAKQLAAKSTRGELEVKVSDAVHHMNDAMSIKHAMAQKEAQMRKEQSQLMGLEREAKHIEETHSSLVASLHRVLEPKLMFARERLDKKEMLVEKESQAAKNWQEKKDQLHEQALEVLKRKKAAHQSLLEAERKVSEAKKVEQDANRVYEHERQRTGQEVQSFHYSETRYKAEVEHEKLAEEAALSAKESVKKLSNVLEVESEKVEESMQVNRNRIRSKMEQIEASREKSAHELTTLQHRYREWQENQRMRAAEVVQKSQDTALAAQAYADRQKEVLESAQTKVAHDAESKSDWAGDSWESGFSNDAGYTDATPSLSD